MGTFDLDKFEREKERLNALKEYEQLISDNNTEINKIVQIAAYICDSPISLVNLIDSNFTKIKAAVGTDMKTSPREISFCSKAIEGESLMEISDTLEDERFKNNPLVTGDEKIRFYAGTLLRNHEGQKMGTICVFDNKPKILSSLQREMLDTLAKQISFQLENHRKSLLVKKSNISAIINLENENNELRKKLVYFQRFLPPKIAAEFSPSSNKNPIKIESKKIILLIIRLNNFSEILDHLQPYLLFKLLEQYYSHISNILSSYNGIIYQYQGSEIHAMFDETFPYPHIEKNAVFCAFEILKQSSFLNKNYVNSEPPRIILSLTMNSGEMNVGTIDTGKKIKYIIAGKTYDELIKIKNTFNLPNSILVTDSLLKIVKNDVIISKTLINDNDVNEAKIYLIKNKL